MIASQIEHSETTIYLFFLLSKSVRRCRQWWRW